MGCCFVVISIYFWKTQELKNLSQLYLQTESKAVADASESEIRYRGIYNALRRLANQEAPNNAQEPEEWGKDTAFLIDSFEGIKNIAWVDKNYVIRAIAPRQGNESYLNQKANEIILGPSDIRLMVPMYQGTELEGFILGTISIDVFMAPVISGIENDYMLQLSNEGKTVFTSENWKRPNAGFVVDRTITLQDAAVLNLNIAPTDGYLNFAIADARTTLILGLLFSFITIVAVHFAQNYYALSKLNVKRYRQLLEDVQLVAIILDINGHVTFCNDYLLSLTGWNREEVLGKDWFARFVPSDCENVKEIFQAALSGENVARHYENPILTRSGEQRLLVFNNTALWNTRGECIGIASIGEDITERRQAVEEIHKLNVELEERVADRTVQLKAANQELEAFAYSVSHDLRAPLRAMEGFSAALLSQYKDKLDEQGQHYLERIQNSSQRMGQLINDLLNLSRITRSELTCQPVDLSDIAQEIVAELQKRDPQRQVEFVIAKSLIVQGDAHLLRIALQNLLENAWKFSGTRQKARIEVGQTTIADCGLQNADLSDPLKFKIPYLESKVYFVRDNGAGFDMAYADKLFGPFQRLHAMHEFPGTGIGLAIVLRVITRHGGRVWPDAQVGQGATFYFTFGGIQ